MAKTFGELLKDSRKQAGLTLRALAPAMGVSVPYLCDVEHGKRHPFDREKLVLAEQRLGLRRGLLSEAAAIERGAVDVSDLSASDRGAVARFAEGLRGTPRGNGERP
jgi:transcriptional regulator with XRE-family HTH domain